MTSPRVKGTMFFRRYAGEVVAVVGWDDAKGRKEFCLAWPDGTRRYVPASETEKLTPEEMRKAMQR